MFISVIDGLSIITTTANKHKGFTVRVFANNTVCYIDFIYYCSWFHGNVSRDEVMRRLNAAKNGVFIIRESSSHPGNYALSVR